MSLYLKGLATRTVFVEASRKWVRAQDKEVFSNPGLKQQLRDEVKESFAQLEEPIDDLVQSCAQPSLVNIAPKNVTTDTPME